VPAPAAVTTSDNCDQAVKVSMAETVIPGACSDSYSLQRTWTSVDSCGNSVSHTQTITVQDTTVPVLSSNPANAAVECDNVPEPTLLTATDNCSSSAVTFTETRADGACPSSYVLTRAWTAADACGNSVSHTQIITVQDTTGPVLSSNPANALVECDSIPAPALVSATDNCDGTLAVEYSESAVAGACEGASVITRTWTATDECGTSVVHVQTLTVVDTTSPVLSGTPADVTVECDSVPAPAAVTTSDNCDQAVKVSMAETVIPGACSDSYSLQRTWTSVDSCGNSVSHTQTITVQDTTVPVLSSNPANAAVECDNVPEPTLLTATDNCSSSAVTFTETRADGACPSSYVLTRAWTAADACGNSVSHTQTVSVSDTQAPILVGVPADATVPKGQIPAPAQVVASDNCDGSLPVDFTEVEVRPPGSCDYTLIRTWTVTDACGNTNTAEQVINVTGAVFLILDEDALDNGLSTIEALANAGICGNGDPATCVNDDIVTDWTLRTPLFSRPPTAAGTELLVPGGQVSDEGWFVATQGFNSPITPQDYYEGNIADESTLDKTPGVFALGNADLNALIGQCICAVVYDSDVSMTDTSEANLQGATLGLTAFFVVDVIAPGTLPESGSSSSLNDVLIELADPNDVPTLCQVAPTPEPSICSNGCDDVNSCTADACSQSTGFCSHEFNTADSSCSATVGSNVIIDCAAGTTTICYDVHTNSGFELSHESICVPDGVSVTGSGTAPCQRTEYGRDGSIDYNGTVFKFECTSGTGQPFAGQFCLTFDGVFEVSEDNLAWIKRGGLEEETRTLGISACGQQPVLSDVCTSSVAIHIDLSPTASKSTRIVCNDDVLRAQVAEMAGTPLFYTTVLQNDDDDIVVSFIDSPDASAAEAAQAVILAIEDGSHPSCLRNAEAVELVDIDGDTLYEIILSSDSSSSPRGDSARSGNSGDSSDASLVVPQWMALIFVVMLTVIF